MRFAIFAQSSLLLTLRSALRAMPFRRSPRVCSGVIRHIDMFQSGTLRYAHHSEGMAERYRVLGAQGLASVSECGHLPE